MSEHGDKHDKNAGEHKPHKKHGGHGGHGAHEEHEEGVPEWVVSFADNVLLQMGFFVILLAMNMGVKAQGPVSEGEGTTSAGTANAQMLDMAIAIREAFNSPVDLNSESPDDQALIRRLLERAAKNGESPTSGATGTDKNAQSVRPSERSDRGNYVEFSDRSEDLSESARRTLEDVSKELAGQSWIIEVRGHASALEARRDPHASRELSYQRAYAVALFLAERGLDWRRIRLVACGDSHPVVPRAGSASEHATNQRVEVVTMPEAVPDDPFSKPSGR